MASLLQPLLSRATHPSLDPQASLSPLPPTMSAALTTRSLLRRTRPPGQASNSNMLTLPSSNAQAPRSWRPITPTHQRHHLHLRTTPPLLTQSAAPPFTPQDPSKASTSTSTSTQSTAPRRQTSYIPAPLPNSGPLLERRSDRSLPALSSIDNPWHRWRHFPLVLAIIVGGALVIFNYEKSNGAVVSASVYALRVHPRARQVLGEEIYFKSAFPWIWGSVDPMHGLIDVRFAVKGSKGAGMMRFRCTRKRKRDWVGFPDSYWWLC